MMDGCIDAAPACQLEMYFSVSVQLLLLYFVGELRLFLSLLVPLCGVEIDSHVGGLIDVALAPCLSDTSSSNAAVSRVQFPIFYNNV